MSQTAGGGGLDPIAIWGAITGSLALIIEGLGFLRDRPNLQARVETDFPEFAPNRDSDQNKDTCPTGVERPDPVASRLTRYLATVMSHRTNGL